MRRGLASVGVLLVGGSVAGDPCVPAVPSGGPRRASDGADGSA